MVQESLFTNGDESCAGLRPYAIVQMLDAL